ncbi:MAG: transcriptional regulator, TetR family [Ilumatobacteraceae bacterium]|nr:transcriptional regulator, TetR family [Ilumatobacteraceae bacterium]
MMVDMSTTPAGSVRARVRAGLVDEIKQTARRHLAEQGASALSLRAVAREVGMVSSAVYRYFPSRDDLLTALIVDAYSAVGAAVEEASARRRRSDVEGRWWAICAAVRHWAVANPHEWALLYGSPVPGYAAPVDTVGPAGLAPLAFLRVVADGVAAGIVVSVPAALPRSVRSDFARLRADAGLQVPDDVLARAFAAWAGLFGSVSLELFGHLHNVITDDAAYFESQMRAAGTHLVGAHLVDAHDADLSAG